MREVETPLAAPQLWRAHTASLGRPRLGLIFQFCAGGSSHPTWRATVPRQSRRGLGVGIIPLSLPLLGTWPPVKSRLVGWDKPPAG